MIDAAEVAAAAAPLAKAVAGVVAENAPVVKTTSGESVANGVWTLVSIIIGTLGTFGGLWLRYGARWRELAIGARKSDIDRLDERIAALEGDLKAETTARVGAQMQVSYLVAAFGMVSAELERQDPNNGVIRAARQLVAQATTKDGLSGDLIRALDMAPDVPLNGGKHA